MCYLGCGSFYGSISPLKACRRAFQVNCSKYKQYFILGILITSIEILVVRSLDEYFFKLKRLEYYGNFNNNGMYGDHDLVMVVVCFHSVVGDDGGFGGGSNKGSEVVVVAASTLSLCGEGGNIGTNGDNIGGSDTVT